MHVGSKQYQMEMKVNTLKILSSICMQAAAMGCNVYRFSFLFGLYTYTEGLFGEQPASRRAFNKKVREHRIAGSA